MTQINILDQKKARLTQLKHRIREEETLLILILIQKDRIPDTTHFLAEIIRRANQSDTDSFSISSSGKAFSVAIKASW